MKQIRERQCYGKKCLSVKMREEMSADDVEDIIMGKDPIYKYNLDLNDTFLSRGEGICIELVSFQ